ncbi:MAG: hypothetical protein IH921_10905 [Gemmatimonadetes bacterium]|nr:hypothetical protein [Gemmatimonadota bacterium]
MTRIQPNSGGRLWFAVLVVGVACALPEHILAQSAAPQHADVVYATVDGKDLALDIYMPTGVESPPLLVWVHGGAWSRGTKAQARLEFVEAGIAQERHFDLGGIDRLSGDGALVEGLVEPDQFGGLYPFHGSRIAG